MAPEVELLLRIGGVFLRAGVAAAPAIRAVAAALARLLSLSLSLTAALGSLASMPATNAKQVRDLLEPTLTPATYQSVKVTHVTSDVLTIVALGAMELRRRRLRNVTA